MADTPKRILVSGSRQWPADEHHRNIVRDALRLHGPGIVVHGAAQGLDRMAAGIASRLVHTSGWPRPEAHPADWEREGARAGPLRNQAMVDAGAAVCLVFPTATSIGSYDCAARAERARIPVVWFPDEGVTDHVREACMQHARRRIAGETLRRGSAA